MDWEAWKATAYGVAESQTQLNTAVSDGDINCTIICIAVLRMGLFFQRTSKSFSEDMFMDIIFLQMEVES